MVGTVFHTQESYWQDFKGGWVDGSPPAPVTLGGWVGGRVCLFAGDYYVFAIVHGICPPLGLVASSEFEG